MMKRFKRRVEFFRCGMAAAVILCGVVFFAEGLCAESFPQNSATQEETAVLEAAKKYFDAEMAGNHPAVYASFAPSSTYCASHDYKAFLAEASASPVRITEYKIVRVAHIRNNEDQMNLPQVEKLATVEVDVVVFYQDTKEKAQINIGFTFIKERGKWYKG